MTFVPGSTSAHRARLLLIAAISACAVLGVFCLKPAFFQQTPEPAPRAPARLAPLAAPATATVSQRSASIAKAVSPWQKLIDAGRVRPEETWSLIRQMSDSHDRAAAATAVCLGIADLHPRSAMLAAWDFKLGRFAETDAEATLLEKLSEQWASKDLSAALDWAATLPSIGDRRRDNVVKGIARAAVDEFPSIAAKIVADAMSPDNAGQTETVVAIARHLAARDRDAALVWLAHFPEGPAMELGIIEIDRATASTSPADRTTEYIR